MHPSAFADAGAFFKKYASHFHANANVLDVGSYNVNGTMSVFVTTACRYVGLDIVEGPGVTLVEPIENKWTSLADNTFDVIISSQTLEHCRQPWELLREAFRVLKPDGILYACSPNTIGKHEFPIDCFRFWADGMRGMLEWAGFTVLECYESEIGSDGIGDTTGIAKK